MGSRALLPALLVVLLPLAGCLGGGLDADDGAIGDDCTEAPCPPTSDGGGGPGPVDPDDASISTNDTGTGGPNGTSPPGSPNASLPWEWPPIASATIRPGAKLNIPGSGQCTANFIFLDAQNTSVHLGTSAHCLNDGDPNASNIEDDCDPDLNPYAPGKEVTIAGASKPGRLVYSSWYTMAQVGETGAAACDYNDFAIIQVHPDDAAKVHPAMYGFGGPDGTTTYGGVGVGDKVLTFGATDLRPGPEQLDAREGYVIAKTGSWVYYVYTATPGLPGDSGSAVVLADGPALGVLKFLALAPYSGANGVIDLQQLLDYARDKGGHDFRLAAWQVIDDGDLP